MVKPLICAALVAVACASPCVSQAQQPLVVGIQDSGVPLNFVDAGSHTAQGLCIDVITEIAKDVGFEVRFEPMAFGSLLSALTSGRVDIIASNMTSTPERRLAADFSQAYYTYGEALVVPVTDTRNYTSVEELTGMVVGTVGGSTYVAQLNKAGASARTFAGSVDVLQEVNDGHVAAGMGGAPTMAYLLGKGTYPRVRRVSSYKAVNLASIAFVVRKTDGELLKKIDASLARLKADGTVARFSAKWGLE